MRFDEYKNDDTGFKSAMNRHVCEHTIRLYALLESAAELITVPKGFKLALHLDRENGCFIIVPEDELIVYGE